MNHPFLARLFAVTRRGRRTMLVRTFAAGMFMTLLGGGMLGGVIWSEASDFNWNRVKPTSMLLSQADRFGGQPALAREAWKELSRRARAGRLDAESWDQYNDILDRWAPKSPRVVVRAPIAADIADEPRRMVRTPTRSAQAPLPRPVTPRPAPTYVVLDGFDASLGAVRSESTGYADEIRATIPVEQVRLTRRNQIQPILAPNEPRPVRSSGFDSLLSPGDTFGQPSNWTGVVMNGRGLSRTPYAVGLPSLPFGQTTSRNRFRAGFGSMSTTDADARLANRITPMRDGDRLDNRVATPRP